MTGPTRAAKTDTHFMRRALALARDALLGHGYAVEWHEYPMPHSVCLEEIVDIGRWLAQTLAPRVVKR